MTTFADRAIRYNQQLTYTGLPLPPDIRIMNPFEEDEQAMQIVSAFYHKYYNDNISGILYSALIPAGLAAH